MSSVELAKKYIKDVPCKECKGSGKCSCSSCIRDRTDNHMIIWQVKNPIPLPTEIAAREWYSKKYQVEREKSEKWARSVDTCPKCGGKGTRAKINYEKLDNEVQEGIITDHERFAIIKDLGNTFGAYYFQY